VVRDAPDLIALYLCPGTVSRQRSGPRGGPQGRNLLLHLWTGEYQDITWHTNRVLLLYQPGDAHSTWLFWREVDGAFIGWYVNLELPWRRTPVGFDTQDRTLDVVIEPDLSAWRLKDEDELAWKVENGILTPDEAAAIGAEADRAIERARQRDAPYCDDWPDWKPDPTWTPPLLPANWDQMFSDSVR
jgi:hypothetical protein